MQSVPTVATRKVLLVFTRYKEVAATANTRSDHDFGSGLLYDLTTLPSNHIRCYPSAKAINGRETYERRAYADTAGGTQPGDAH